MWKECKGMYGLRTDYVCVRVENDCGVIWGRVDGWVCIFVGGVQGVLNVVAEGRDE